MCIRDSNEHRRVVLRRSRHNNLLRTSVDVALCLFLCEEYARGLNNVLSAALFPADFRRIHCSVNRNLLTVNDQACAVRGYFMLKLAVYRVVLCHVNHVVQIDKRIVNTYDVNLAGFDCRAEYESADTDMDVFDAL